MIRPGPSFDSIIAPTQSLSDFFNTFGYRRRFRPTSERDRSAPDSVCFTPRVDLFGGPAKGSSSHSSPRSCEFSLLAAISGSDNAQTTNITIHIVAA